MDYLAERLIAGTMIILGPLLTIFDLPGNTLLLITSLGFALYDEGMFGNSRLLAATFFIYALGEGWEFCVSLFGIKRKKVSWLAVLLIGIGGFIGTLIGTAMLPVLGSFAGGIAGAYVVAFLYEYIHTGRKDNALALAMRAAKVRFLALIGKLAAGILLAFILFRQVFWNHL